MVSWKARTDLEVGEKGESEEEKPLPGLHHLGPVKLPCFSGGG